MISDAGTLNPQSSLFKTKKIIKKHKLALSTLKKTTTTTTTVCVYKK